VTARFGTRLPVVLGAGALALAHLACGDATTRPPPAQAQTDAASPVDGSVEAALPDASPFADATSDAGPASQCVRGHAWATAPATPWESPVTRFGGVSSDELTIAWTASADDAGGPLVEVATRLQPTDGFGPPTSLPMPPQGVAPDRVALDPGGFSLLAVAADRTSLVAFARADSDASSAWSQFTSDQFASVAAAASDTGSSFYEPALGLDGSLYYVLGSSSGLHLYQSTWNAVQHAWATGVILATSVAGEDLSSPDVDHLRRPTGASGDGLTLFFFDGVTGHERAAWRDAPTVPFSHIEDMAAVAEAAPDPRCDRLYFQQSASGASGVFTAQ
jgi:hypothetical protein